MNKVFMAIAAILISIKAFAQPASLPNLASKQAFIFSVVPTIRTGTLEITAPSLVGGTIKKTIAVPASPTIAKLTAAVDAALANIPITVTNPDDYVNAQVSLKDANGAEILSGGGGSRSVVVNGVRSLPAIEAALWPSASSPVTVGNNVAAAEMVFTHPLYGYTTGSEKLAVTNGAIPFTAYWAGQGRLILTLNDGKQVAYDLRNNGVQVSASEKLTVGGKSIVYGFVLFTNVSNIVRKIPTYQGQGENEAYEITLSAATSVKVTTTTSENQNPVGYLYQEEGQLNWSVKLASETNATVTIDAKAGVLKVIPFFLPEDLHPYLDSGKG